MRPLRAPLLLAAALLLFPHFTRGDDPTTQPAEPAVSAERVAAKARCRDALRRPISVNFKNVPLVRALAMTSRQAMVPTRVDWAELELAGVPKDCPISLQLRAVPADRVLELILRCASDPNASAGPKVYVDADGVHIALNPPGAAVPDADQPVKTIEVAYEVADLVRAGRVEEGLNEQVFDDLDRLIEERIANDTWKEAGGSIGSIRIGMAHPAPPVAGDDPGNPEPGGGDASDPLIVTTSPEIQRQVADLLSRLRDGLAGIPPRRPAGFNRTLRALQRPVPATFRLLPLGAVLDSIRRSANINLFIDWQGLALSAITPESLVSISTPKSGMLPAGDALLAVFEAVGDEHGAMSFDIDPDGIVEVFGAARPAGPGPITCCYNVRVLLQTRVPSTHWPADASFRDRLEAISTLVQIQVAPDSWKEQGGQIGSIRPFGWILVITQTPLNQERVAAILQTLP